MGKNQQHKAAQQARHGGGANDEQPPVDQGDGTVDVSFHSPEWHAARIAALTTERVSWEDFKKKQKDDEKLAATEAADEEKAMQEYRRQLDADRANRLSKGVNNAHLKKVDVKDAKSSKEKKRKRSDKDKDEKKSSKSKKSKDKRRKEKSSKDKKDKKSKKRRQSSSGSDSSDSEPAPKKMSSPVRLSEFFKG
mmetsp:Transcript_4168/g.12060  ORF Transcript_4168/g.12060 Transcript_4168/m.12060 type:complete len:193 (-) Transcript_4168:2066-2644(-)|eukprot:CAMPEP_0206137152 /NCGR_PEP_ID=MMETSP1473-20131121/2316_1 /ASSEMBLY_ACC=CAM_ASM_001109 /TAXON_ID=1461547 /ORGANISM="Stichococcus sp, Strain RCC1054" /LENGTH=192 /DNA_ID=CAMNT_0053530093 /DNA_START=323 /DNA_END=901 /DNA_ORIENTATION=-